MDRIRLGILGLGARSTTYYIGELNRQYNVEKGGYSTCPFILVNADFDAINARLPDTSRQLDAITQQYIAELEKTGIERILIPNITLHETIDRLIISKKIIHPVHLAISKIKTEGWPEVILFGSVHTMRSSYIPSHFAGSNINVQLPSSADMLRIDDFRKHVYSGTETNEMIKEYHMLIEKYGKVSPVVLACTELSIFKPTGADNLLDLAELQIAEALEIALRDI